MFRTYQCDVLSHPHDLNKSLESSPGPPLANEICGTCQRVRYISLCDNIYSPSYSAFVYLHSMLIPVFSCVHIVDS